MINRIKSLVDLYGYRMDGKVQQTICNTLEALNSGSQSVKFIAGFDVSEYRIPSELKVLMMPFTVTPSGNYGVEKDLLLNDSTIKEDIYSPNELDMIWKKFTQVARYDGTLIPAYAEREHVTLEKVAKHVKVDGRILSKTMDVCPVELNISIYDDGFSLPYLVSDLMIKI